MHGWRKKAPSYTPIYLILPPSSPSSLANSAKMKKMKGAPSSLARTFSALSTHPHNRSGNEVASSREMRRETRCVRVCVRESVCTCVCVRESTCLWLRWVYFYVHLFVLYLLPYIPLLPSPPSPPPHRPSLLDDEPVIVDPLQGMRGRRHSTLDEFDGITEEDDLTTEDFDSDDGMLDDDFNGWYFIQIVHFIQVALQVSQNSFIMTSCSQCVKYSNLRTVHEIFSAHHSLFACRWLLLFNVRIHKKGTIIVPMS